MTELCTRQVHLDFHTAGQIPEVGADWNADAFVDTLKRAHVNSITCFSRGHHGYVYYQPSKFPAHPHLKTNLLGEQIEACHRAGIRVPIYVTVGWDEVTASRHPEWLVVTPDGKLGTWGPMAARWKDICLNSPYVDYAWEQTEELLDLFGDAVDGFFFDIIKQDECVCQYCLAGMASAGLDPNLAEDRQAFGRSVLDTFRQRFSGAVRARQPDATIFYNYGHIPYDYRPTLDTFTHLELESLPSTGQWGYNHYPIAVRYAQTLGKPLLGMTGKFHTAWGDFCSFKNQPALEYECFQMLATGAACSIGDQLPPRGRLSEPVYALIGSVYSSVEAKEPWCVGAVPQAEIAVFNVEAVRTEDGTVDTSHSGALRMLLESHHQFQFVDEQADWSPYKVLVLPDKVPLDDALAAKVRWYLGTGGQVIASHRAGLAADGSGFMDEFGISSLGDAPHSPDYALVGDDLGARVQKTPVVMYDRALAVEPKPGTRVLASTIAPYFDRTWEHFCSHRQTPPDLGTDAGYPSVTMNAAGNIVYLAHPVFAGYRRQAVRWYKQLFLAALDMLLPQPMVRTDAPTTAQITVLRQMVPSRTIVHVLHYIPERRGTEFDTIEDVIPLHGVSLCFRTETRPRRVYLAPDEQDLSFCYDDGHVRVTIPRVVGHAMIVAES